MCCVGEPAELGTGVRVLIDGRLRLYVGLQNRRSDHVRLGSGSRLGWAGLNNRNIISYSDEIIRYLERPPTAIVTTHLDVSLYKLCFAGAMQNRFVLICQFPDMPTSAALPQNDATTVSLGEYNTIQYKPYPMHDVCRLAPPRIRYPRYALRGAVAETRDARRETLSHYSIPRSKQGHQS